jgi:hypothetical protein
VTPGSARRGWRRAVGAVASGLTILGAIGLIAPAGVLAHALGPTYTSRLPLAVYLAGAAVTVALSFIFVFVRDVRAERPATDGPAHLPPALIRIGLRALGLLGWAWIVVQGILGGGGGGAVAAQVRGV